MGKKMIKASPAAKIAATLLTGLLLSIITRSQNALPQQAQHSGGRATVSEYTQPFPSYPFSDPNPIPVLSPLYPYFRYDGFTTTPINKKWKVVALENDYIQLLILPEIGGKIWAAIEKKTHRPFLYYNHAVKFRDIAMRGPWTSGGLEANYGIIGHTPACATPVDYFTRTNSDGSVSCFIGTLDLLTRSYWRVEIRLPADKAFFTTSSFWYNTTPLEEPYYHWMNAGLKAGDDLEFVYPGNKYLGHNGEHDAWPVDKQNGKLISWYKNNDFGGYKSYHVFGKYTDFTGAFWHNDNLGIVRYGGHDDKAGKKIWIWGLSRQGMIWEKLLTDTDGQYVEMQSGRLFNQNSEKSSLTPFKHRSFPPYSTDTWKEYWYPVLGTHGFVTAGEYGALNLLPENGMLKIYLSPVQRLDDTLRITLNGNLIYQRRIQSNPLSLFADSITLPASASVKSIPPSLTPSSSLSTASASSPALSDLNLSAVLGDNLLSYSTSAAADTLGRPTDAPAGFDWTSVYGYYVKACEALDQKDYREEALSLDSALAKDSNYLPALVKKAALLHRNMRDGEALQTVRHALAINTEDGETNFVYGLVNDALGHTTDAIDGFDIAALDPAWRSAAYTSLARIRLRQHLLTHAGDCAAKSLEAQPSNMDALQLAAVIFRLQQDTTGYHKSLQTLLSFDPLNFFARWESSPQTFDSLIRNELPQEIYLELAIWYHSCGQDDAATAILHHGPPVAEIQCWLSFMTGKPLDSATLNPLRSFPFRSETGDVLEKLLTTRLETLNPAAHLGHNDMHEDMYVAWFLRYQLALLYHDKDRSAEALRLLTDCGDNPRYAPFYAFRAALQSKEDSARTLADLQKAAALDAQWRYQKLLAEYYIAHQDPVKAGAIAGKFYRANPSNYIMGMLYAKTLLLNRQYKAGNQLLSRLTIIPFEGATAGRELYREAKLMQAVDAMKNKNFKKALNWITQARQWPENLGVGQPYPENEDLRLEDWMSFLCYSSLHQENNAKKALQNILNFQPVVYNTVPNFIAVNNVISVWANSALADVKSAHKDRPAALEADLPTSPAMLSDANTRVLMALKTLQR